MLHFVSHDGLQENKKNALTHAQIAARVIDFVNFFLPGESSVTEFRGILAGLRELA
jgi:hypothetical protein